MSLAAQTLRPYQQGGVTRILAAFAAGALAVLAVSPTGSGKTSIFCWLAARLKVPVVILVHRRELAKQAANRLTEFGVDFGYVMPGKKARPYARVQICMVQTLARRLKKGKAVPPAGLVICDEAHLSTAASWASVIACYPDAKILGFTATPWRMAGKPLVGAYNACVVVATPNELREMGFLSPYVGFGYMAPDLDDLKTTAGEYNEKQSAEKMRAPAIVANIVEMWLEHARDLSTVVFAVNVEHSLQLTAEFKAAGVVAEHLDGKTPTGQRDAILERVDRGETRVLCNVGVAIEGLDIPRLKCCVLARPTKSLARAIQMMGRVRRPWQGVTARIHDHAFVIDNGKKGRKKKGHGLPDADRDYTLNAKDEKPPSLATCEECRAIYSGRKCPSCDHVAEPKNERAEMATVDDAEQFGFTSDDKTIAPPTPKPPIPCTWNTPGLTIEGAYEGSTEDNSGEYRKVTHVIEGVRYQAGSLSEDQLIKLMRKPKRYALPGGSHLNQILRGVQIPDLIRIEYKGDADLGGGKFKKLFRLWKDDGK